MRADVPGALGPILASKVEEVAAAKRSVDLGVLLERVAERAASGDGARDFAGAVRRLYGSGRTAVIAEVKRKSPSAGWMREEYVPGEDGIDAFDPTVAAAGYERAGAAAVSCLTDEPYFGGELGFLDRIKSRVGLPVLRKDFLIDVYQIVEARAYGADGVLLIAECLDPAEMRDMVDEALGLGMGVLLEVHDEARLSDVASVFEDRGADGLLMGVNNRDLTKMTTDIGHAVRMSEGLVSKAGFVAESGIRTRGDVERLREAGIEAVLVGEHLMKSVSPGDALREMLRGEDRSGGGGRATS